MKKGKSIKDSIENTLKMSVDVTVRFEDSHTEEIIKRAISMASKFSNREEFPKKLLKSLYKVIKSNVLDDEEKYELELLIDRLHVELDIPCD